MGVDFRDCAVCGETVCDCGPDWNLCGYCGRVICTDCLDAPYKQDETDEMSKECCPFCSGTQIHNDDLLEFILKVTGIGREEAKEMYREAHK